MTDRRDLADRLALAIVEHGPLPSGTLALLVKARRVDVAGELARNPIFAKSGSGRGTRWSLSTSASEDPRDGVRDGLGREDRAESGSNVTRAEFDLLRRRVDELEQRLAEREVTT